MDAATAGDNWSRCRHRLGLQLPLPLSLIRFGRLCLQWIGNDLAGFWIGDGGSQVFKTAERSGIDSNAGSRAGYNATYCVCLWRSSGCWCATTVCTQCGSWRIFWLSLCSRQGGSHALSDICNPRIVQRRWGGGVLTLDCRGYWTPSLRGIPLTSRYGNQSLSRRKLRIHCRPTLLLIVMISKTSNISYDRSDVRVRALGSPSPI